MMWIHSLMLEFDGSLVLTSDWFLTFFGDFDW